MDMKHPEWCKEAVGRAIDPETEEFFSEEYHTELRKLRWPGWLRFAVAITLAILAWTVLAISAALLLS